MWRSSRPNPIIRTKIIQENNKAREMAAAAAAKKAAWIMHQTKMEHHPYLERRDFPTTWPRSGRWTGSGF
jgi:hypothetical protein